MAIQGARSPSPSIERCAQIIVWFGTAVVGTIVNKSLMKVFPYPIIITVVHLVVGICFDFLVSYRKKSPSLLPAGSYTYIVPAAVTLIASKVFTYVSYGKIPASLTHTIKASAPIFSVLLSRFYLKHTVSTSALLSLIPIMIGVTLSSVTDVEFQLYGFLAAVLSTLIGSLQNIFTKYGLIHIETNPVILHLHTSVIALAIGIPAAFFTDVPNFRAQFLDFSEYSSSDSNDDITATGAQGYVIPQLLVLSMLLQYAQTMGSLFVLSEVSAVTHQVSATLKRLVIIVSAILYFGNEVQFLNYVGVFLALSGFFAYGQTSLKCKGEDSCSEPLLPQSMPPPAKPAWFTARSVLNMFRPLSQPNLVNGLK